MTTRCTGRSKVSRKPDDTYAVLAIQPAALKKRIREKNLSIRGLADLAGHASHSHLYRLTTGEIKTTSVRTADVVEAILDARGLLFGRVTAKPLSRAA